MEGPKKASNQANLTPFHQCRLCEKFFVDSPSLQQHMLRHRKVTNGWSCEVCDKKFNDQLASEQHKIFCQHNPPPHYICDCCDRKFSTSGKLDEHRSVPSPCHEPTLRTQLQSRHEGAPDFEQQLDSFIITIGTVEGDVDAVLLVAEACFNSLINEITRNRYGDCRELEIASTKLIHAACNNDHFPVISAKFFHRLLEKASPSLSSGQLTDSAGKPLVGRALVRKPFLDKTQALFETSPHRTILLPWLAELRKVNIISDRILDKIINHVLDDNKLTIGGLALVCRFISKVESHLNENSGSTKKLRAYRERVDQMIENEIRQEYERGGKIRELLVPTKF